MPLITWSEEYELGHETIDFQHKELVRLLNNLNDAKEQGTMELLMEITLDELLKYTQNHFTQEESFMADCGFDDREAHSKAHAAFIEKVSAFKESYDKGESTVGDTMINFLRDWLVGHILKTDKELVTFLNSK